MTQRRGLKLLTLFLLLVSARAFAYIDIYDMRLDPVVSVAGGAFFTIGNAGDSQYFPIVDPDTDEFYQYQAANPNNPQYLFGLFLGNRFIFNNMWALQAGLDYTQSGTFQAEGNLTQGADDLSESQFQYHYNIITRQLLAEAKLLYQFKQNTRVHPYALFGIGASFNNASDFNTSIPYNLTFTRQYQNHSTVSFSYSVGIGVDVDINYNLSLGLGYRFGDLGNVSLGTASINGTSVGGTIHQDHLYANEMVAQLSYYPFEEQFRV
jgi:opacity protein-like surface antigen